MSHGDSVTQLPKGFKVLAMTQNAPFAVIVDEEKNFMEYNFTQK